MEPTTELAGASDDADHPVDRDRSDVSVFLHVIEELCQHLGQMEVTADVLLAR